MSRGNLDKPEIKPSIKIKIKEIGPNLKILGANVCSVTKHQIFRRFLLKNMLGTLQPDIAIFLETNLEEDWNCLPSIYTSFRTDNDKNCGVLILVKHFLGPFLANKFVNKGLCVKLSLLNINIIGLYTPYYSDIFDLKNIFKTWTYNQKFLVFGDHEKYTEIFTKLCAFSYIPPYSRKFNNSFSLTDCFYGNMEIINSHICDKVSDHFALSCEIKPGVEIHKQNSRRYKRSNIITQFYNLKSSLRHDVIKDWPEKPMIQIIKHKVPLTKSKQVIWIPNIRNISTRYELKNFEKKYFSDFENAISSCILNNDLRKLAVLTRQTFKILSKRSFPKGVRTENGEILVGEKADSYFSSYYSNLFSSSNNFLSKPHCLTCENANIPYSLFSFNNISKHKALSIDLFPDELLMDKHIQKKLISWCLRKLHGEPLEPIYNQGKLILINKTNNDYPLAHETRPIVVLSPVRKFLETVWYRKYSDLLWKNIGPWQIGFREKCSTHDNIVKLCNWLIENRKGAIGVFVDVHHAFDSVDRAQILKLISECGVDYNGITLLYNLLIDMSLNYQGKIFSYTKGVPQGSVLSPILFNLLYDVVLKEANALNFYVLGFADDLFIGIKHIKDYPKLISWLDSWPSKIKLNINISKTKEFRIGKYRNTKGKFESVNSYKYLGIIIPKSNIIKSAKKRCRENINFASKFSKLIWKFNHKVNFLVNIWWFFSCAIYYCIHGIMCKFYTSEFVRLAILKKLRKISSAPPRMSNSMLEEYFGLNIVETLEKCLFKISKCNGNIANNKLKKNTISRKIWTKAVSTIKITPKQLTAWISETAWKAKKRLKCKFCHTFTYLRHLAFHNLLDISTEVFLHNIASKGIYQAVEQIIENFSDPCTELIRIIRISKERWTLLCNQYSYLSN